MKNVARRIRSRQFSGNPRFAAGVGMIEVLIAVAILAFGMLGIAAMQATSLRKSQSALERSQATVLTYSILDRMRANRDIAIINGYTLNTLTCDAPDRGDRAANDMNDWITSLKDKLGDEACGQINCGSDTCTITVQWDDSRAKESVEAGDQDKQIVQTVTTL